jgi:hypothetical protein
MNDDLLDVLRDLARQKSNDMPRYGDAQHSVDRHYEKNEITHQQVEPLVGDSLPLIPEPTTSESDQVTQTAENLDSMSQVVGYRSYEKNEINEKITGCIGGDAGGAIARREEEPERPQLAVDLARCAGCGEVIRPDEPVYDYHNPGDESVVARAHSGRLECLIAWNEKWHAAEGRAYDAEFYRQHLNPGGPKPPALPAAPMAQWSERIGRLDPGNPPADVPLNRWRQFLADARRLIDDGTAARAAASGWTGHDLFGCDGERPFARVDQMGLVWFVKGGRIVSISMSAAVIETPTGARQTYRRKDGAPGRVLVWELAKQEG